MEDSGGGAATSVARDGRDRPPLCWSIPGVDCGTGFRVSGGVGDVRSVGLRRAGDRIYLVVLLAAHAEWDPRSNGHGSAVAGARDVVAWAPGAGRIRNLSAGVAVARRDCRSSDGG